MSVLGRGYCSTARAVDRSFPIGGVQPRKELYANGWPNPILVLDDNGLAVVTSSNTVDIFDQKARAWILSADRALKLGEHVQVLQDDAYFVRPSRALPLDTPGISMVNLPGRGRNFQHACKE